MVRVIWTPAALEDLNDIKDFITGHSALYALEEAKVEEGLKAGREGKLIPHSEIKKMVDNWFKDLPKEG